MQFPDHSLTNKTLTSYLLITACSAWLCLLYSSCPSCLPCAPCCACSACPALLCLPYPALPALPRSPCICSYANCGGQTTEISQPGHKTVGGMCLVSAVIKRFIANFAGIINTFCFRSQAQTGLTSFALFFMLHLTARHNKGVSQRFHNVDNGGTAVIRLMNEWDQAWSRLNEAFLLLPVELSS